MRAVPLDRLDDSPISCGGGRSSGMRLGEGNKLSEGDYDDRESENDAGPRTSRRLQRPGELKARWLHEAQADTNLWLTFLVFKDIPVIFLGNTHCNIKMFPQVIQISILVVLFMCLIKYVCFVLTSLTNCHSINLKVFTNCCL